MSGGSGRPKSFGSNVFINCPFDAEFVPLLRPLLFTVLALGFNPRLASERSDSTEIRVEKILELIRKSKYSIHDISRLKSTAKDEFSRFNLPFELGLAHASRIFGPDKMRTKKCLVLEADAYDFKRALSDMAGADIKSHGNKPEEMVRCVRDWFVETVKLRGVPSPTSLWYRFCDFYLAFDNARTRDGYSEADVNFMPVPEYIDFTKRWLAGQP